MTTKIEIIDFTTKTGKNFGVCPCCGKVGKVTKFKDYEYSDGGTKFTVKGTRVYHTESVTTYEDGRVFRLPKKFCDIKDEVYY